MGILFNTLWAFLSGVLAAQSFVFCAIIFHCVDEIVTGKTLGAPEDSKMFYWSVFSTGAALACGYAAWQVWP